MLKGEENWKSIHQFMCSEYKFIWNKFLHPGIKSRLMGKSSGTKKSIEDRPKHKEIMYSLLERIAAEHGDDFILKGGAALMRCYGLDRV